MYDYVDDDDDDVIEEPVKDKRDRYRIVVIRLMASLFVALIVALIVAAAVTKIQQGKAAASKGERSW